MTPEQIAAERARLAKLRELNMPEPKAERLLAHIDALTAATHAALTSEDEIAHGEAVRAGNANDARSREGIGVCAYCDGDWPCRTQRGIDRLLAIFTDTPILTVGVKNGGSRP